MNSRNPPYLLTDSTPSNATYLYAVLVKPVNEVVKLMETRTLATGALRKIITNNKQ